MKNGSVSWWKGFAIKRQAIEIEILASGLGVGSEGTHATEMKYKWENNGGLFRAVSPKTFHDAATGCENFFEQVHIGGGGKKKGKKKEKKKDSLLTSCGR